MRIGLPAVATARTQELSVESHKVLRNTYMLLALTLVPTAAGALAGMQVNFSFMASSPILWSLGFIAGVYGLFFAIEKNRDSGVGVALLLVLTGFLGLMLGPVLQAALKLANGGQIVMLAAGGTAAVFFAMAGIATTTRRDFGFMANFLMVGAVVLMIAVIANLFMQIPALALTISAAFILFSSAMILFTVNQVVRGGETNYITATLSIYMGIYNVFASLLQILMAVTGQRE